MADSSRPAAPKKLLLNRESLRWLRGGTPPGGMQWSVEVRHCTSRCSEVATNCQTC